MAELSRSFRLIQPPPKGGRGSLVSPAAHWSNQWLTAVPVMQGGASVLGPLLLTFFLGQWIYEYDDFEQAIKMAASEAVSLSRLIFIPTL
jgi:hypothetical protein